jgi:UDP-N-acetylglucosamine/UDP-N-acetylgalactosamine 4-epimerase
MVPSVSVYESVSDELLRHPRTWVVTGAAGFIGSNLVEHLLRLNQQVIGLDNFSTGYRHNVDEVFRAAGERGSQYRFVEGDICNLDDCIAALQGSDVVLHQAALGSVPRSIAQPVLTNRANVDGFLNVLVAAREAEVSRVVYASSSAVYGDHPQLPKVEDRIGVPLSPYAVSKYVNELYGNVFASLYGTKIIGLRYFNVFGPRQDPNGAYAAVIPRWIGELVTGAPSFINGDGETSRDFCFIDNVVQANLLAAMTDRPEALGQVYNIAVGERTTLNELFRLIRDELAVLRPEVGAVEPNYRDFREGDVRHSLADISKARTLLGYEPTDTVPAGMRAAVRWYLTELQRAGGSPSVMPAKAAIP